MHTHYSEIVISVPRDKKQRAGSKIKLDDQKQTVQVSNVRKFHWATRGSLSVIYTSLAMI